MINPIDNAERRSLVVVLGMARSGTSAITRALPVLGVRLGDNLMEPLPGINEKGFWEDLDIYQLNIELLRELQTDWQSHGPIPLQTMPAEKLASFRLRASALLRERTADAAPFGFKDPRTSRLLAFWRPIFDHLGLDQGYVISLRDPLSVARSLAKAWGFGTEKACYLWLEYVVDAVAGSRGARRVVVDFDALIADPVGQVQRIASTLDLPLSDPQSPEWREYTHAFLDESLRHARFETEDLRLDPAVPQDAIDAHSMLRRVSADELSIDDPEVAALFDRLRDSLKRMAPALMQMRRQDETIGSLTQTVAARDAHIAHLDGIVQARDERIVQLDDVLAERDRHIAERDAELARVQHELRVARQELNAAQQELQEAQQGLHGAQQELSIAQQESSSREAHIAQLTTASAKVEQHVRELQAQLEMHAGRISDLETTRLR
jgi:hypothetical protein